MNRRWVAVACVATALFGAAPALAGGRADHLICYKMTDKFQISAAADMIADLQPQFSQRGCTLVKPFEFCVPATKDNVQPPPTAPDVSGQPLRQDYVCYVAKCPKTDVPGNQVLADQFGVRPVTKFQATKICVPATKFPVLCGTNGGRSCNGACPAGQQCVTSPNGCNCQPAPCEGSPDKAGVCGGTCTDPLQICRKTVTSAGKIVCACGEEPPPPCGKNPLTGTCGGDCTDPTLKCLPDANQNCVCSTPPTQFCAPVIGAAPTCGGTCPNPADQCTLTNDSAHPCICQPGPCHQDPTTGQCTGFCDPAGPGGTCHLEGTECVCGPPPCGIDAATGQCGGPCPDGEICAVNAANQCGCGSPCQTVGQNVCGGGCPPGLVCHLQGQDCTCAQPPPCGFGAETAGACGGFCPAGTTCDVRPTAAGLSCTCQ